MTATTSAAQYAADPLTLAEHSLRRLPSMAAPDRERVRTRVIEMCMPWARREAGRYFHGQDSVDDLTQVAILGLILAVDRYEPQRQIPFRHFARPTVNGEIKKYFRDRGWSIRVSRRTQELYQEVRQAEPQLSQQLGRTPTDEDLAEHLQVSVDDVRAGRRAEQAYRHWSLNHRIDDDDDDGELLDRLGGPDPSLDLVVDHDALRRALRVLPERMRLVLSLRFLDELTQCEIADKIGVSQMQVSRLLSRALARLRAHMLAEAPTSAAHDPLGAGPHAA